MTISQQRCSITSPICNIANQPPQTTQIQTLPNIHPLVTTFQQQIHTIHQLPTAQQHIYPPTRRHLRTIYTHAQIPTVKQQILLNTASHNMLTNDNLALLSCVIQETLQLYD